ncbi:MAG: hybrid sensor histidine kinase/response regulator, partial [Aurantibacter sp.]
MKINLLHIRVTGPVALALLFLGQSLLAQDSIPLKDLQTYFEEARIYSNQDKADLALEALENAAKVAEFNENVKGLVDSYHKFAILNLKLDKEDAALLYWDRAKGVLKDIEYPYGNAMHKYIEGLVEFRNGKSFQARYLLDEAKQLNNDRNMFNNILLVEGNIFLNQEKYEDAKKNFNSLVINTDIHEKEYLATNAHLGLSKV